MSSQSIQETLAEQFGDFTGILRLWAAAYPDEIALRDDSGTLDWRGLADRIERLAARMQAEGLKRGQSVAILGTSCIAYALVFLAVVRAGGVAAPLTTSASPKQLQGMVADSGADLLFIDAAKAQELGGAFATGLTHVPLESIEEWMRL